MAKRVIQMYDKYKSTTKTYPKIIKECLQEDVIDLIEGQVEANPTLAGTEASLTGLQVGDTKYVVPQGTTVIANPDPAGETELTGLQIGDTKYKVGGGKQLYQHNISIGSQYSQASITIINDVASAYTSATAVSTLLYNMGFRNVNTICPASGMTMSGGYNVVYGLACGQWSYYFQTNKITDGTYASVEVSANNITVFDKVIEL